MEAHRGRIWAESDGEGLGTRFTFTLPAVETAGSDAVSPAPARSSRREWGTRKSGCGCWRWITTLKNCDTSGTPWPTVRRMWLGWSIRCRPSRRPTPGGCRPTSACWNGSGARGRRRPATYARRCGQAAPPAGRRRRTPHLRLQRALGGLLGAQGRDARRGTAHHIGYSA